MEALKNFRKTLDSIPWVIELLLVIFFDGLYGGIYRMTRGDTTGVIIGIVWLVLAYLMSRWCLDGSAPSFLLF